MGEDRVFETITSLLSVLQASYRQHLSYHDWRQEGRLSELFCAVLCTEVVHSHKHT